MYMPIKKDNLQDIYTIICIHMHHQNPTYSGVRGYRNQSRMYASKTHHPSVFQAKTNSYLYVKIRAYECPRRKKKTTTKKNAITRLHQGERPAEPRIRDPRDRALSLPAYLGHESKHQQSRSIFTTLNVNVKVHVSSEKNLLFRKNANRLWKIKKQT